MRSPIDGALLKFYEGQFDTIFVSLNPFFRVDKAFLSQFEEPTDIYETANRILSKNTEKITWAAIQKYIGFKSFTEIDLALRTSIGGLKKEFERTDLSERLYTFLKENAAIFPPSEGEIPFNQERELLRAIEELGYRDIVLADEFGEVLGHYTIREFLGGTIELAQRSIIYTPDAQLLISLHWDSHHTYICSDEKSVGYIVQAAHLEGFYADVDTEVYWSLGSDS